MNFTKAEQRLMSPKYAKQLPLILWAGILFLVVAVILVPIGYKKVQNIRLIYQNNLDKVGSLVSNSHYSQGTVEALLVSTARNLKTAMCNYVEATTEKIVYIFAIIGCSLIGIFFQARLYLNIIHKIQNRKQ
jgi:hypothetical protein